MTPPRDAAVDAVLTAFTLIQQFHALRARLSNVTAEDVDAAVGEAKHIYPAIWENLDAARALVRARGIEVPDYDSLRARQPEELLGITAVHTMGAAGQALILARASRSYDGLLKATKAANKVRSATANEGGIGDAVEAIAALRSAMPHVQWGALHAANSRSVAVLEQALTSGRRRRAAIALALVAALIGIVFGIGRLLPTSEPASATAAKKSVSQQIAELREQLEASPCDAPTAEQLVTKLRINGRLREARELGAEFIARCGDNEYISSRIGARRAE